MDSKILNELGLTNNEIKIFLSLVKNGSVGATEIAKKTGLNRPYVYYALERLLEKGYISEIRVKGKKNFRAIDFDHIISLEEHRVDILKDYMKDLEKLRKISRDEVQVEVLKGRSAVKNIFKMCLSEEWHPESPYDDQTYPQQVIGIGSLLEHEGKPYRNLRRELNRFTTNKCPLTVRDYDPKYDKENIEALCKKQDKRIPGFLEAHKLYLEIGKNDKIKSLTFEMGGKIAGFTLYDEISSVCISFNVVIHDPSIPFFSTMIAYETARVALSQDYKFFNFQGSETQSLDTWKKKFNPVKSINKTHLIYRSE